MKAELIHIECGHFNGIANYKLGDKILRFELGTPNYNDYGEYRVNTELESIEFDKRYAGYIPTNVNSVIELTDEQAAWWLNVNEDTLEFWEYMKDCQVCGGTREDEEFVIFNKERKVVTFPDWEKEEHDPYEHFMFNVLNVFYHWYLSGDCKPRNGLMIYPKL